MPTKQVWENIELANNFARWKLDEPDPLNDVTGLMIVDGPYKLNLDASICYDMREKIMPRDHSTGK